MKGKRNVAQTRTNLPSDGKSGRLQKVYLYTYTIYISLGHWQFSMTPKGFMNGQTFCEVLKDLDNYLRQKEVQRPVVLFFDGLNCHINLEVNTKIAVYFWSCFEFYLNIGC